MTQSPAPVRADSPTPPPAKVKAGREPNRRRKPEANAELDVEPAGFWRRVANGAKQLVAIVIFALLLGAASLGVHRVATTTPRFAITKLEITGSQKKSDTEIKRLGGIRIGDNIFAIDTRAVEQRLVADPWIRDAKVIREIPNTLRIDLDERDAAAVAIIDGETFLLTRSGEPFKAIEEGDPYDLPMVTGISPEYLARDRERELERVKMAMEVLRHYERIPMSRVLPPQEAHVDADGSVSVSVGKEGVTLRLGKGPWRKKLLMAARVVSLAQKKGQTPGIVFLDNRAHPERVVVRMR